MLVAGARPNFVKVAPVLRALEARRAAPVVLVHTGQHYDDSMSGSFFRTLAIPEPDVNLGVGPGSDVVQTARIMERLEPVIAHRRPATVVVFGDVGSTVAAALVASKLGVPIAHVEAGLRSGDRSMPEEVNRVVTDALADVLLVSEPSGMANLRREGKPPEACHLVGNVMIDSLAWALPRIASSAPWQAFGVEAGGYGAVTLHRPANVDDDRVLRRLWGCLRELAERLPLVVPLHPRTRARLDRLGERGSAGLKLAGPLPYLDSIALQSRARVILTDSGGIQDEASCLGVPCLTLRATTERPITVERGTSTLVSSDPRRITAAFDQVLRGAYKQGQPIDLWDGQAAGRIADVLLARLTG
jgi:UDP-N-acetylglucosamine 2-epimerase (non-hydrolysing)